MDLEFGGWGSESVHSVDLFIFKLHVFGRLQKPKKCLLPQNTAVLLIGHVL